MKKNNNTYIFVSVINITIPLILGLLCYLIFSRNSFPKISGYVPLEIYLKLPDNFLTYFFRFYFADAMWAYSFFYSLMLVFFGFEKFPLTVLIYGIITIVLIEILQLWHIINGTFDICDIIIEIIFGIISICNFYYSRRTIL